MSNLQGKLMVAFGAATVVAVLYGVFGPSADTSDSFGGLQAQASETAASETVVLAGEDFGLEITIAGAANGTVTVDLFEDVAPGHVAHIVRLAQEGAYDNVVFHRVIEGFMAQTGDVEFGKQDAEGFSMQGAGRGGSQYPDLAAEFSDTHFETGVLGMARSQSINSANSQFFIMFADAPHLNGQYTVVGKVTAGMDVVDAIKRGEGPNGAVIGAPDVMTSVVVTAN